MVESDDGDGHGRRSGREEALAKKHARREQQAHGTWLTTTVTAQASTLSLLTYAHHAHGLLGQCMLPCTPKRAPHLPNIIMPTQSCTHLELGRNTITKMLPPA